MSKKKKRPGGGPLRKPQARGSQHGRKLYGRGGGGKTLRKKR